MKTLVKNTHESFKLQSSLFIPSCIKVFSVLRWKAKIQVADVERMLCYEPRAEIGMGEIIFCFYFYKFI